MKYPCSKKNKKKNDFSNLLSDPMGISLLICMHFIPLARPEKQLLSSV